MTETFPDFAPAEHIRASEMCVAGAAALSAENAEALAGRVKPGDFRGSKAAHVYATAIALAEAGKPVDPVAVMAEITRAGTLERIGGPVFISDCVAAIQAAPEWHADQVAADARRRDACAALMTALDYARSPGFDPATGFEEIRERVDAVTAPAREGGLRDMDALMASVVAGLEKETERGLPTGLADLDRLTGGLAPGELVLAAARPSIGKSVLVTGIAARAAADLGLPVLLCSLEMSAEEITLRLIASHAKVAMHSLMTRQLTEGDWDSIQRSWNRIGSSPLVIDDAPDASLAHIRSRLRGMARTGPARLLVVDYLGLMSAPKAENRQAEVAALSRGLKLIAREFAIPVLAAAQLNRGPEHRQGRRPQMSDLRESGAQEQDADLIILLHREDAYEPLSPRRGEIDLIVDKNRQGPKATITAAFQGHYARIVDMAPDPENWSPHGSHVSERAAS